MFRLRTHRLLIALLAQIVICLVAAPVIGARQGQMPPVSESDRREKPPADSRATIEAAFDASNVRPEEDSDAGQKKGKVRSGARRGSGGSLAARGFHGWGAIQNPGITQVVDDPSLTARGNKEPCRDYLSKFGVVHAGVTGAMSHACVGMPAGWAEPSAIARHAHASVGHGTQTNSRIGIGYLFAAPEIGVSRIAKGLPCPSLPRRIAVICKALRETVPAIQPTGPPIG